MSSPRRGTRILSNAGWMTAAKLAGYGFSLLLFLVLSRAFGPEGVGEYAYGAAIGAVLALVVAWGLVDYGVREFVRLDAAAQRRELGRLGAAQLALALAGIALFALFLVVTDADARTATVAAELAAFQLCLVVAQTLFVPSFAREAMALPAIAEGTARAVAAGAAIAAVLVFGKPLPSALLAFPFAGAIVVAAAFRTARRQLGRFGARATPREIAGVLRAASPFAASELAALIWGRADVIMLRLAAGESIAGLYAAAVKIVDVATLPLHYLSFSVYPRFSELAADRVRLTSIAVQTSRGMLLASALLLWGVYYVAPALKQPLFGASFGGSEPALRGLAILLPLLAVEIFTSHLLLAGGRQIRRLVYQGIATAGNVALNLVLIPRFGMAGAVFASILAMGVGGLLNLTAIDELVAPRPVLGSVAEFFAIVACAALPGLLLVSWAEPAWIPAAVALAVFCAAVLVTGYARPLATRILAEMRSGT
jgi:O-antigen/teichoic acid export membrane protein